jgi:hypothetical protein
MTGTGLRDDTTLGAIRLDWWAASDWNGARNTLGIPGRLRRNPQPIDQRRRDDIAAAVAAHDRDHPDAPLPRNAGRLLAVMFPVEDVCQRSQEAIAAEGFSRDRLPAMLRRLVEAGFLSRHRVAGVPDTYRLHLPPVQS